MLQLVTVPPKDVQEYRPIVGDTIVDELQALAAPFRGARVLHLNATGFGGGVAELLATLVPLMRSVGIDAEWKVMAGAPELWDATKAMHNLLQGASIAPAGVSGPTKALSVDTGASPRSTRRPISASWGSHAIEVWKHYNQLTAEMFDGEYDFVVVHDPQPAGVVHELLKMNRHRSTRWIWRCHIDLTHANPDIWSFLRPYLADYDAAIFTMQQYVKSDIPVGQVALVAPAIDPFSLKNCPMSTDEVRETLRRFDVDPDRPLLTQVSRFDPWKDPLGVVDVYRRLRKDIPGLQLAMVASMAADDPEGWRYYEMTARHAGDDYNVHLLTNFLGVNAREVNAFQRASNVVLQKSIREGFALTVSEALWKARPVVATSVGGIPLQVASGETGYLVNSTRQCVQQTRTLLKDPELSDEFGLAGRERVRRNFLMTRNLGDYLQLFQRVDRTRAAA